MIWIAGAVHQGLVIDHLCRNTSCCNPLHLELVTPKENWIRGHSFYAINSLKTHCPRGHEYSGDNLYVNPNNGRRTCKTCNAACVAKRQKEGKTSYNPEKGRLYSQRPDVKEHKAEYARRWRAKQREIREATNE